MVGVRSGRSGAVDQVKVWTGLDQAQPAGSVVCFKATGATGYLALSVPEVFGIATYADRSLTAELSAAGATADGFGQFTIRNAKDNLCIDAPNYGAVPAGTPVAEYTCNGTSADNQLFRRVPRPDGGVWIVNVKSNLCLDVDGVRTGGDDTRLTLYTCSDNDDHTWQQI